MVLEECYHLQHGMINAIILPIVLEEYGDTITKKLAYIADIVGIAGHTDQQKAEYFIKKLKEIKPSIRHSNINTRDTGFQIFIILRLVQRRKEILHIQHQLLGMLSVLKKSFARHSRGIQSKKIKGYDT